MFHGFHDQNEFRKQGKIKIIRSEFREKNKKKKLKYFINFKSHKDFFQQKNKPLKS